jgi:membrane protein required for colicin V production
MANFNWVDYIIVAIFILSILAGFGRGLVKEVVSLITLIAAFVVAIMFANPLATAFTSSSSVQNAVSQASTAIGASAAQPVSYLALGLSFGLLFAGTIIAGAIISSILNLAFQTGILGIGNRILGGVFGFFRGYIINLVMIFLVQLSPLGSQSWWQQSQLVGAFQPQVAWLGDLVSPSLANLKAKFGQTLQGVNSSIQNMTNTSGH